MAASGKSEGDDLVNELLLAVQAKEPGAWERLVDQFEHLLWSIPRRMGYSEADSADIVQGAWILIWRHIEHVRSGAGLPSWLITTTAREAWRFGRKASRAREHEDLVANTGPDIPDQELPYEDIARLEEVQLVRQAIRSLDERCSALLAKTDLGGLSYKDAAKVLGIPLGSVGPTRMRCLAKLMEALVQRGVSE